MARTLDGNGHGGYRCRFTLRQITQEMISHIHSTSFSNPDRNVCNNRGWYPSKRMSGLIRAESRRIELLYPLEFEHDEDVLKKRDKPP
jgi:hypothetical protein